MKKYIYITLILLCSACVGQTDNVTYKSGILQDTTATTKEKISRLPKEYYSFSTLAECKEVAADIDKMNGYPRQGALRYCKCIKYDTIYYLPVDRVLERYEETLYSKETKKINGKTISKTELNDYEQLPQKTVKSEVLCR